MQYCSAPHGANINWFAPHGADISAKAQSNDGEPTIERGDLISDEPDNWTVHAVDGPLVQADEVVVEWYDGYREPEKRDNIERCECGMLVFGGGPCYGCFKMDGGE